MLGLAIAVVGVAAYCLTRSVLASAATDDGSSGAVADPLRQVASEAFVLDTEGGARFRPAADVQVPYDGSPRTLQVVTMPVYRGGLSVERVDAILAAGRAEALERRLGPGWDAMLQREVQPVDDMLQEVVLAMREEEAEAIRALESSGEDTWTLRADSPGRSQVWQSMRC